MINTDGFMSTHGMPAGIAEREVQPEPGVVKVRLMTDEERAALDAELSEKLPKRGKHKPMYETMKVKIFSLLQEGLDVAEIVKELHVGSDLVLHYKKEYDAGKQVEKEQALEKIHADFAEKKLAEETPEKEAEKEQTEEKVEKPVVKRGRRKSPGRPPKQKTAKAEKADAIHPSYYLGKSGQDVFDVAMDFGLNALSTMALKYIVRAGRKDPAKTVEDLGKAIECLARETKFIIKQEG